MGTGSGWRLTATQSNWPHPCRACGRSIDTHDLLICESGRDWNVLHASCLLGFADRLLAEVIAAEAEFERGQLEYGSAELSHLKRTLDGIDLWYELATLCRTREALADARIRYDRLEQQVKDRLRHELNELGP